MPRLCEQWLTRYCCGLPERVAPAEAEGSKTTEVRQRLRFVVAELATRDDVSDRTEWGMLPFCFNALAGVLTEPGHVAQAETEGEGGPLLTSPVHGGVHRGGKRTLNCRLSTLDALQPAQPVGAQH